MYKAVVMFRDAQDNGHLYRPGDTFPRDGLKVDAARIEQLSGTENRRGIPLIAEVAEKKPPRKRVKKNDD